MPIFIPSFGIALPGDPRGPIDVVVRDYGYISLPSRFDKVVILPGRRVYPEGVFGVELDSVIEVQGHISSIITSVTFVTFERTVEIESETEESVGQPPVPDTHLTASSFITVSAILDISYMTGVTPTALQHEINVSSLANVSN